MDDKEIIALYFHRDQEAIAETDRKYGGLCRKVSYNILNNREDAEECVADTYMGLWHSIPPQMPAFFKAYILKILRNFSLMRFRDRNTQRHGSGEVELAMEELGDTFSSGFSVEQEYEGRELAQAVSCFLRNLSEDDRNIFLCRYWHLAPVAKIAERLRCSQSKVKTSLFRTRKKLQLFLTEEGLV